MPRVVVHLSINLRFTTRLILEEVVRHECVECEECDDSHDTETSDSGLGAMAGMIARSGSLYPFWFMREAF